MKHLSRDYTNRCGNCQKMMESSDLFCRYCGTPKGEGDFKPYENLNLCVYGPPMVTTHKCQDCGYSWDVRCLGRDGAGFCPKCGGEVSSTSKENW